MSDVEVDELAALVGDVTSEVPSDEAVPHGGVHLFKGLADEGSNLLLCVVGANCLEGDLKKEEKGSLWWRGTRGGDCIAGQEGPGWGTKAVV